MGLNLKALVQKKKIENIGPRKTRKTRKNLNKPQKRSVKFANTVVQTTGLLCRFCSCFSCLSWTIGFMSELAFPPAAHRVDQPDLIGGLQILQRQDRLGDNTG